MMPDRCLEVCRRTILIDARNVNNSRADHEDQIELKKAIKVYKKIDAHIRDEAKYRAERLRTQRAAEKPEEQEPTEEHSEKKARSERGCVSSISRYVRRHSAET